MKLFVMTPSELARHKYDIQCQAIEFYKLPSFFPGEPKYKRWKSCVSMVAQAWLYLGPQAFLTDSSAIILPPP